MHDVAGRLTITTAVAAGFTCLVAGCASTTVGSAPAACVHASITELSCAARTTVEKVTAGGRANNLTQEDEERMLVYHREATVGGEEMQSTIARGDGMLLSRETNCATVPYTRWFPREEDRTRLGVSWAELQQTPVPAKTNLLEARVFAYLTSSNRSISCADFHHLLWTNDPYTVFHYLHIRGVPASAAGPKTPENQRTNVGCQNGLKLSILYGAEFDAIQKATGANYSRKIGLALSGGGIRSAAVATGFLTGLHEIGVLSEIGYLSTVSGGGLAGSWYMMHEDDNDLFAPGSLHLQHLAEQGRYLTSSHYSRNTQDLITRVGVGIMLLPVAALLDEVFYLERNVYGPRDHYRQGIKNAFQYEEPFRIGDTWPGPLDRNPWANRPTVASLLMGQRANKPFWICNMNLILSADGIVHHKNRSGDAFELTPLRAGADAVGYVKVPPWGSHSLFWMWPDYAAAISGAAFDSDSLQFNWFQSTGGYLINANLGYYIRGWSDGWLPGDPPGTLFWRNTEYWLTCPLPIHRILALLFPKGIYNLSRWHEFSHKAKYYGLTDGGHFDNLGVYALVRRGCRAILVCDAGADKNVNKWDTLSEKKRAKTFSDERKLEEKLQSDFGAELEMDWKNLNKSQQGILVRGKIRNLPVILNKHDAGSDTKCGELDECVEILYFKPAYDIARGPQKVGSYADVEKAEHRTFPHEPTATKQGFSEREVLAYRRLGYELAVANTNEIWRAVRQVKH